MSASGTCLSCFITPMLCARRIAVSHKWQTQTQTHRTVDVGREGRAKRAERFEDRLDRNEIHTGDADERLMAGALLLHVIQKH